MNPFPELVRRPLAIAVILAFVLALIAPAQAAWSCPDGTPCVRDGGESYVCAKQCGSGASCCRSRAARCKHGATPSLRRLDLVGKAIGTPDHCRFSIYSAPHEKAVTGNAELLGMEADLALTPAVLRLSLSKPAPSWRSEYTLGYRPPPLVSLGPSRAPPTA